MHVQPKNMSKSKAPVVTGIKPKEAVPGTEITIRGENFGSKPTDLQSLLILGADCTLTAEWKSSTKITALCPAKEGIVFKITKINNKSPVSK